MKLYLHIGSHKTGTTTIQRFLSKNIDALKNQKVWYPRYSELINTNIDHYAHLDLAKALGGVSNSRLGKNEAELCIKSIRLNNSSYDKAIISAEPFYRLPVLKTNEDYWIARENFIRYLRKLFDLFEEVEVVVVLRRQDSFLVSMYAENITANRYSKDILTYYKDNDFLFDYKRQCELWNKYFPLKVLIFEDLVSSSMSLEYCFINEIGVRGDSLDSVSVKNITLPVPLIEYKRIINETSLSIKELNLIYKEISMKYNSNKWRNNYSFLSDNAINEIYDDFYEENQLLRDKYMSKVADIFPKPRKTSSNVFSCGTSFLMTEIHEEVVNIVNNSSLSKELKAKFRNLF